ncbi:unnamed protein product [Amaranthus hypochondriacus]
MVKSLQNPKLTRPKPSVTFPLLSLTTLSHSSQKPGPPPLCWHTHSRQNHPSRRSQQQQQQLRPPSPTSNHAAPLSSHVKQRGCTTSSRQHQGRGQPVLAPLSGQFRVLCTTTTIFTHLSTIFVSFNFVPGS